MAASESDGESAAGGVRPPYWLVGLVVLALASVGLAYWVSAEATALQAVSAAGSLLLSIFLVYLYREQVRLLANQQEIQERQQEIMHAAELKPRLRSSNWELDGDGLSFTLKNVGDGIAQDLTAVTRLSAPQNDGGVNENLFSVETPLDPSDLDSLDSQPFATDVRYGWQGSGIGDTPRRELDFEDISRRIVQASNGDATEVDISLQVHVVCNDAMANLADRVTVIDREFTVRGPSRLHGAEDEEMRVKPLTPDLTLQDYRLEVAPNGDEYATDLDVTGFDVAEVTLENTGDWEAYEIEIGPLIQINQNDTLVDSTAYFRDSDEYDITVNGWPSSVFEDENSLPPGESATFTAPLRASGGELSLISVKEAMRSIIDAGFEGSIALSILVVYGDGAGNGYQSGRMILDIPDVSDLKSESSEVMTLTEALRNDE